MKIFPPVAPSFPVIAVLALVLVQGLVVVVARRYDFWWNMKPGMADKFSNKFQHRSTYSNEENVTWRIKNFKAVEVERSSAIYTTDPSTVQLEIMYDNLENTTVRLVSNGTKVMYEFFYGTQSLIFDLKEQIRDQFIVVTNGTLQFHPEASYQAGFTVDDDTGEKDYFAYTCIYPYATSELFPGVIHGRQTAINLKIEFTNSSDYTLFVPNYESGANGTYFFPKMVMDNLGFVIVKRYDTYLVMNNLRVIVHRLSSNDSIEIQVVPFLNATELVAGRLCNLFNITIPEMITIMILPRVREDPMAVMRDYCILDISYVSVVENEKHKIILQCLIQQYFFRTFSTRDQWSSRFFRGLRDYLALSYETIRELDAAAILDAFSAKSLRFYEDQETDSTRRHMSHDPHNYRIIEFLSLIRDQLLSAKKTNTDEIFFNLFDNFKIAETDKEDLTRTRLITEVIENPNPVIDFYSIINVFEKKLKGFIKFSKNITVDEFLTGWLKMRGHPIIESRFWKDPNTSCSMVEFNAESMACDDCHISYPMYLVTQSRIQYVEERRRQKGNPTYHLINDQETIKDDFWLITDNSTIREEPLVGSANRTSTYYYLSLNGTQVYRTFYRDQNWKELLRHYGELPVSVRVRLISDITYFHAKGMLSWNYVWVALSRLKYEKSQRVWLAAEKLFLDMERKFRWTSIEREYHELVVNTTRRFYNSTLPRHPMIVKLLCMSGLRQCLLEARDHMVELITNNGRSFDRMEDILCAGARAIDLEYYDHLLDLVKKMDYKRRYRLMIALTCFQDKIKVYTLLQQAFVTELLITPPIVKIMMLLNAFLCGPMGAEVTMLFIQQNPVVMKEYFDKEQFEEIMMIFAGYLKDRFSYRQAKAIMTMANLDHRPVTDKIQSNMIWYRKNEKRLKGFFHRSKKIRRILW